MHVVLVNRINIQMFRIRSVNYSLLERYCHKFKTLRGKDLSAKHLNTGRKIGE